MDWTWNEYEFAGQIDNSINHVGFGVEYTPDDNLSLFIKYVYSKWKDVTLLDKDDKIYRGHHNFFAEVKYNVSPQDEFVMEWRFSKGVSGALLFDPYGGTLSTLDTQHILRAYYKKLF